MAELWIAIFGLSGVAASRFGVEPRAGLAGITSRALWDEFSVIPSAKAIGQAQWVGAMGFAREIDALVPGLPAPVPGADPDGFIWLTWHAHDGREFALELHASLVEAPYRWTVTRDGMKRKGDTGPLPDREDAMRAVVENLRATFGDRKAEREGVRMVEA
jgi:hypothetical protein